MTRGGMAESVSRDQILRRERGQEKNHFPDHKQDWQPLMEYIDYTEPRENHNFLFSMGSR